MPEVLKEFLEKIRADASSKGMAVRNDLWNWLDGNPNAVVEMLESIEYLPGGEDESPRLGCVDPAHRLHRFHRAVLQEG